ncbi:Bug family tripartite tricarboxylate transporter substrate binding protein, partial [Bradyrhizobium diazoefficiens]
RCGSRRRRARNSGRATPSLRHEPGVALSSWSTLHFHPVRRAAAGTVKVLAVFSGKRTPYLPDVPTLAELGYTGIDFASWGAVVAPKGLPPAVHDKLTAALEEIVNSPSVIERFTTVGFEPGFMRYSDWAGAIGKETAEMKEIAQRAGIKEE